MSTYWPQRPSAKGFSIERLANDYRQRLATFSSSNKQTSNIESSQEMEALTQSNPLHWANRDFAEYRQAS